jgi:hypothetical protein
MHCITNTPDNDNSTSFFPPSSVTPHPCASGSPQTSSSVGRNADRHARNTRRTPLDLAIEEVDAIMAMLLDINARLMVLRYRTSDGLKEKR